jgi:hypothetical protein
MKSIKIFFALAIAAISFISNACENSETKAIIAVKQKSSEELVSKIFDNDFNEPEINIKELFYNCYRSNDPRACQELIALAAYAIMVDRAKSGEIILSQEKTIATLRETLDLANEREKRRVERISKRKQAKK